MPGSSPLSDYQNTWIVLCRRAKQGDPNTPFEISEVVPELASRLKVSGPRAERLISMLLGELGRLPEGRRYFRQEGYAVVPLPEFASVGDGPEAEVAAYPFEL